LTLYGGEQIGYYLDEENGWQLNETILTQSLNQAKSKGINPVGLVVINPGNPTGAVLSQENIAMIIKFAIAKGHRDRVGPVILDGLKKGDPAILHDDLYACDKLDVTETVRRINIPVLAICGDNDKMTPPALSRYIADNVPGGRLALIPGAGHFVMNEEAGAFNKVLKEFIISLQ